MLPTIENLPEIRVPQDHQSISLSDQSHLSRSPRMQRFPSAIDGPHHVPLVPSRQNAYALSATQDEQNHHPGPLRDSPETFRVPRVSRWPATGCGSDPRAQGCTRHHAHRGRKISLLPAPCTLPSRRHHRRQSSHRLDEGPGRCPRGQGNSCHPDQLFTLTLRAGRAHSPASEW